MSFFQRADRAAGVDWIEDLCEADLVLRVQRRDILHLQRQALCCITRLFDLQFLTLCRVVHRDSDSKAQRLREQCDRRLRVADGL